MVFLNALTQVFASPRGIVSGGAGTRAAGDWSRIFGSGSSGGPPQAPAIRAERMVSSFGQAFSKYAFPWAAISPWCGIGWSA
jgi:hypothetical protein